jgi:hypothetical protein
VPISLLSSLAQLVTGCREVPETRYCVDEEGRILPDFHCKSSPLGISCHCLYGGKSSGKIGDIVIGGSRTPTLQNPNLPRGFGGRGTAGG